MWSPGVRGRGASDSASAAKHSTSTERMIDTVNDNATFFTSGFSLNDEANSIFSWKIRFTARNASPASVDRGALARATLR
jgi:hypothetical protein